MGKKESIPFGRAYNFLVPQDQTPNNPMLPHCDTTMQVAAQAFSEMVHRRNPDFNKLFARNSKPDSSLMTGESREYGNQSSSPKNDRDGTSMSATSGSMRSADGDQDDSNKDSPLSKKQKSNMITEDENPSGLAQNLGTAVKESDTDLDVDTQLKNMEDDERRKERKRLSNRKSAKRSKIKKQKEYEEQCQKINTLKDENSVLTHTLTELSEKCLELTDENDSIEEELVRMYGPESIADLLHMKPT
ncbi:G-box-binding factor 1 [Medicago truncatula]|uniref:G-box-binding factor 1 n=1 Tax=Medicago truncatula TaxID=3880 RepID=UPI0019682B39|nr:G-box-binding factor 1-like [Medicago truncatula]